MQKKADDTIYLTGIGKGEKRLRELAKELSLPLWPSAESPFVTPEIISKGFPPKLVVGVPRATPEPEISDLTSTPVKYFIDTIIPASRIKEFISEVVGEKDTHSEEMTFLLSNETVYYKDSALTFVKSLINRKVLNVEAKDDIRISLHEAMVNALIHGNLNLGSQNRETACDLEKYFIEVEHRVNSDFYNDRAIQIITTWNKKSLKVRIINDGKGFHGSVLTTLPDRKAKSGRGLLLIAMAADSCVLERGGREIAVSFELDEDTKDTLFGGKYRLQGSDIKEIGSPLEKSRVLVIDEDLGKQKITESLLLLMGVETVKTVRNIKEALSKAESFNPHIIIIDVTAKNYDKLRVLKDNKYFTEVPILVETENNTREARDKIFPFGATDFITKPFNPLEFFTRVKVHLENRILSERTNEQLIRLENELNAAQQMQLDLFPNNKTITNISNKYNICVNHYFNSSSEMGGDIWGIKDFGNKIAVYSCDFSGHGVSSAINTFRLHTILEQNPIDDYKFPSDYLTMLNQRLLVLLPRGQFATFFLGFIDIEKNKITYSVSASPRPFYGSLAKGIKVSEGTGLPLGVSMNAVYDNWEIPFNQGDFIFVYSDGMTESKGKNGEEALGEEGLLQMLKANLTNDDCQKDFNGIVEAFFRFAATPPSDDMSAFMISRK